MASNGKLTPRQRKFVDAYLQHGNGAQAAREAGYSVRSAKETAREILTYPHVQDALRQAQQEAARSAGVTIQRIIEEFYKLAFTDMTEFVSWRGKTLTLKDSTELSPAQAAAILEIAEGESKTGRSLLKVKLYSKQQALESLLRCLATLDLEERVAALEEALHGHRSERRWR